MGSNQTIAARAANVMMGNYRPAPVVLDHGIGAEVWDVDGNRFIDLFAGIAVSTVGHAHPHLVNAIATQAGKLLHLSNLLLNEPSIRLAERLIAASSLDDAEGPALTRAFFCNSGTEAVEACVKLARRAAFLAKMPSRTRFLAFHHSFHGRTLGALPLTGTPKYWEGFGLSPDACTHVPYGDLAASATALDKSPDEFCAIIVELVQGEGGVLPAPAGFLKGLRALADSRGLLLILDEVQTGIGRTGRFFGYQHEQVAPDAIALAKGLGGGVPIGAMLIAEKWNHVLTPGTHGSTFGGNPLATAAANAVLDVVESDQLVARAERLGTLLSKRLSDIAQRHPELVESERGMGLMRGLVLKPTLEARVLLGAARERGVLASIASEKVLRLVPALTISESLLHEACDKLDEALVACATKLPPSPVLQPSP